MTTCHLDFETRSTQELGGAKGVGGVNYAMHPDTAIWCACYAFDDGPVQTWRPGDPTPEALYEHVAAGGRFVGHNVAFEFNIWNHIMVPRYGAPPLVPEQLDDTAARAAMMALPRSLEDACKAMRLPVEKDMEGNRLMKRMAKPRKPRKNEDPNAVLWWDDDERVARLIAYCECDVEAERALDKVLRPLPASEREVWLNDFRSNQLGVQVDMPFVRNAQVLIDHTLATYKQRIAEVTGGAVTAPTQVKQIVQWLEERRVPVASLDKVTVQHLLTSEDIPDDVREVLTIRAEAGKSSVAKLPRFATLTGAGGRMRENFLYHGAATGRVAGKGAQLQNLPSRGGLNWRTADAVIDMVRDMDPDDPEPMKATIEAAYGPVPNALSSCLRGCITTAPGKRLYVADFSNIEGRVNAWLGNEQWKLDAFRAFDTGRGPDLYKVTAGQILGIDPADVDKQQRNVMGKVPELALGYQGGVGAFQSMAGIYGVNMTDHWPTIQHTLDRRFIEQAEENWSRWGKNSGVFVDEWLASEAVKLAWRDRHPGIVRAWYDTERAAVEAVREPGKTTGAARGRIRFKGLRIGGVPFLCMRLPSGRLLYFGHVSLQETQTQFGAKTQITYMGVDSVTRKYTRMKTYGGDLYQSATQAAARDLMMHGWSQVQAAGFDVVLTVHDEIGAEGDPGRPIEEFETLMADIPEWAKGCPVAAEGYVADRYRKDD